ncbi:ComEC/Rec2 family competence protein [Williamsia limnetica]|uniref:ComEC/Rec2 family competence protein n=1 Tax=Williamsia limnetica TaxID=882452 RepID=UPI001314C08C|nr:ComEC/Rec2 family competence protein [Williamsia limnetica]
MSAAVAPGTTILDVRLVPVALAAWLITVTGILAPVSITAAVALLATVLTITGVTLLKRGSTISWIPVLIGIGGILAGFGWALVLRQHHLQLNPLADNGIRGDKVTVGLRVTDDPRAIARTDRVVVAVTVTSVRRREVSKVAATVLAPADGWLDLAPGHHLSALVKVSAPRRPDLTVATLTASGPPAEVRAPPWHQRYATYVRSQFRELASRALGSPESGLLPGLVLGDVSALDENLKEDFRAAGLSHLTAVSGANFAIVIGALLLTVRALGVGPRTAVALTGVAIVIFVILVRPSPSVVRAAVMGTVGLLALIVRRRAQAMPALCAAVIILLLVWPAFAVQPGFILSVVATAGLIVIAPVIVEWLRRHHVPRGVAEALAVAIAAQLVTTPVVLLFSGRLSLVAVIANLAVAVVVAPITVLGTTAAAVNLVCPPVAFLLVRFIGPELWWMVFVAQKCSALPLATVTLW